MRCIALAALPLMLAACGNRDRSAEQPAEASTAAALQQTQAMLASAPLAKPAVSSSSARSAQMPRATYAGYAGLRFGTDEAAFRKQWEGTLSEGAPAPGSTCKQWTPMQGAKPEGDVRFMFEGGRFVRYDVTAGDRTAPGGGKIGMSAEQIMALYPSAQRQPQKYDPDAFELRAVGDEGAAVLFELGKDGKVTRWRVGLPPQIDYVEGCG